MKWIPLPALLVFVVSSLEAQSPVTLSIDETATGNPIPPDYMGLSYEAGLVCPNAEGKHYFSPDNQSLLQLYRTLGIRHLRVGGNSSDRNAVKFPTETDIDLLFQFARAANLKVIYCIRLFNSTPDEAVKSVKYIMNRYADRVDSFSVGQEPSAYPVDKMENRPPLERMGEGNEKYQYEHYREEWKRFADAIQSGEV